MPGQRGTRAFNAPNGTYNLVLTVEKPLADKHNPAHFESFTVGPVTIQRP